MMVVRWFEYLYQKLVFLPFLHISFRFGGYGWVGSQFCVRFGRYQNEGRLGWSVVGRVRFGTPSITRYLGLGLFLKQSLVLSRT